MSIEMILNEKNENVINEGMVNYNDDGIAMSHLGFRTLDSVYCGQYIKTLTVGGVGTDPEYRRAGAVRQMLNKVLEMAPERGWTVSFLHPFSFSYYRKFGYEKVADHKVLEFPISKLEFIDRCTSLVPVNSEKRALDCVAVYNEFSKKRNIMFKRFGTSVYPTSAGGGRKTYLWYDAASKPASYITFESQQYFNVNRMTSVNLHVYEMAFTTPQSLLALFGFLRMYEGEDEMVKIHNCAMSPEIDTVLKHYMHTKYTLIPDIMARILDVPAILKANLYPDEHGIFTVKVEDSLAFTRGVYEVEYENGKAEVKKLSDDADFDLSAPMPAFSQLMYGYDEYTADVASYMDGVKVINPKSDFFKIFHKKNNGLFEHF